jgi:predicted MFS family arabinose efflux permease
MSATDCRALRFRDVLQLREFRWLWLADIQSLLGDQLARVALSVLVFDRTRSGLLTAGVYALTYLPALAGLVLGVLADRVPRRAMLVGGDLVRAVLLATMAINVVPLGAVAALLVLVVAVGAPWKAAESALVADILTGEGYALGTGLRVATVQAAQLVGFAVGGAVVAGVGARPALAVDAVTFAVSAVVIRITVRQRPAAQSARPGTGTAGWNEGLLVISRSRYLRALVGLAWLAGVFVVPEGLAAPYAAALHGGPSTVGLLLASAPAGVLIGSLLFVRLRGESSRARWVVPLAVAAGIPLVLSGLRPGLPVTMVLWAASGACMAYQVQIITEFVAAVPDRVRGQAIAVASSGLLAAQGIGLFIGGLVAQAWSVPGAIAVAGGLGSLVALGLGVTRRRAYLARAAPPTLSRGGSGAQPTGS